MDQIATTGSGTTSKVSAMEINSTEANTSAGVAETNGYAAVVKDETTLMLLQRLSANIDAFFKSPFWVENLTHYYIFLKQLIVGTQALMTQSLGEVIN